jgi:hypothetical protein
MPTFSAIPQSIYEATLIPASFRGVPFAVLDIAIAIGRRIAMRPIRGSWFCPFDGPPGS